ncbi:hypothetical protein A4_334 [Escherichia phage A4]|nr:hypothetical protein A4_334 [Escherichia phage A4]
MKTNIQLKVYISYENIYIKSSLCKDVMDYKGKPFTVTYSSTGGLYISFANYENNMYEHIDIEDLSTLSEEEYFQESLVWDLEFPMPLVHKMIVLIKETKQEPRDNYEEHIIEY